MEVLDIGKDLVALCREHKHLEAIEKYYADNVVSIEGASQGDMPARMEGLETIKGKNNWWFENNEVHSGTIEGPYCAEGDNRFVVHFSFDVTPKGGERMQMAEVGIYTVEGGKIVEERFLYLMA
ncbi:MAG: SnoaL-like domain-containing protein [Acidobacteriota bacterium]